MHHRSLPTRKSKNRNIGRIRYSQILVKKIGRDSRCLNPDFSDIASSRTTLIMLIVYGHLLNRKQCGKKLRLLK